jgi:hypothetical protein
MGIDETSVLDELVLHGLLQVAPRGPQLREAIDHVLDEVEPVEAVLHPSKGVVIVPSSL